MNERENVSRRARKDISSEFSISYPIFIIIPHEILVGRKCVFLFIYLSRANVYVWRNFVAWRLFIYAWCGILMTQKKVGICVRKACFGWREYREKWSQRIFFCAGSLLSETNLNKIRIQAMWNELCKTFVSIFKWHFLNDWIFFGCYAEAITYMKKFDVFARWNHITQAINSETGKGKKNWQKNNAINVGKSQGYMKSSMYICDSIFWSCY